MKIVLTTKDGKEYVRELLPVKAEVEKNLSTAESVSGSKKTVPEALEALMEGIDDNINKATELTSDGMFTFAVDENYTVIVPASEIKSIEFFGVLDYVGEVVKYAIEVEQNESE